MVAVGGDGTVHDVANGIFRQDADVALGVVPIGTGNDFAKLLGVYRHSPVRAVQRLVSAEVRRFDVGEVLAECFVNTMGFGFGPAVVRVRNSMPGVTGFFSYLLPVLRAFATFPQVQAPTKAAGRVAQLRTYESHSSERAMMKIRMFEEGGEIAIFKRVGLNPVFFGQTMAGTKMPNVTYMLAFEDEKALKSAWDKFRADADWKTLQGDETYKDAVSNITNLVLRPVGGSQI